MHSPQASAALAPSMCTYSLSHLLRVAVLDGTQQSWSFHGAFWQIQSGNANITEAVMTATATLGGDRRKGRKGRKLREAALGATDGPTRERVLRGRTKGPGSEAARRFRSGIEGNRHDSDERTACRLSRGWSGLDRSSRAGRHDLGIRGKIFPVVEGFGRFKEVHVQHSKMLAAWASGPEPRVAVRMLATYLH
jgi:hypothetical protein